MGQLALGIAGGIVGSFFGMPQLGFMAGSLIGGFLFPAKGPAQQGPRLDNLAVTSSAYGQPIFIVYGTVRIAGNIIWSKPLREVPHKEKAGGKGGGGGASMTTYEYRWSGAVGLCEGPINRILRIWADPKLVYDNTGASPTVKRPDFNFRVYLGDEEQLPDSIIEADVGAANAVAHRGMAYVVFDDIPVKDYGNRPPSFTFEVVVGEGGASISGVFGITDLVASTLGAANVNTKFAPDWKHQRAYKITQGTSGGLHAYNLVTQKEVQQKLFTDILTNGDSEITFGFGNNICVDDDGFVYGVTGTVTNSSPIAKIDGFSMVQVGNVGTHTSSLTGLVTPTSMCVTKAYTPTGSDQYLCAVGFTNTKRVNFIHCRTMTWTGQVTFDLAEAQVVQGETLNGQAVCYLVDHVQYGNPNATAMGVYKVEMPGTAYLSVDATIANPTIVKTKLGTVSPSEVVPWWSVFSRFVGLFFDHHEGRLYFYVEGGRVFSPKTGQIIRYNPETAAVEAVYAVDSSLVISYGDHLTFSRINNASISIMGGSGVMQTFNLATGDSEVTTGWDFALNGVQMYDSDSGAILAVGTSAGSTGETDCLIYAGRASASDVLLSDIVSDLCSRVELESTDIDVTELTDTVLGYVINSQMTVRAAIEPLALAYQFDGVESDDLLKFRKRGQAPSLALTQDDLLWISENEGEVLRETRIQEVELPQRVSVQFIDRDKDYQINTMTTPRVKNPTPTMHSNNQVSNAFPIAMTPSAAKQLSEKLLYTTWIERVQEEFHSAWDFLAADPVDSGTLTLDDGTVYSFRVTGIDVGVNWEMQFKAVNEEATSYTSAVTASGGDGFPQQTPPGPTISRTFILDSPLLRDGDDTGGTVSRVYCAAGGFGQASWPGETVKRSADGSFYLDVAKITTEISWGVVATALGNTSSVFSNDEVNTITVNMMAGEDDLESITQLEMVNGANGAMLLDEATGNLEIIQFRDVTLNANGTYTLSGLLRGRRGTDTMTGTHVAGEIFILLSVDPIESFSVALGEIGSTRYYKGVPYGTYFEDATLITNASHGRDLMPYAPTAQSSSYRRVRHQPVVAAPHARRRRSARWHRHCAAG
jgi:hypothetical protein